MRALRLFAAGLLLAAAPLAAQSISGAGGPPTGTSGHVVGYLDGINTWSAQQNISGVSLNMINTAQFNSDVGTNWRAWDNGSVIIQNNTASGFWIGGACTSVITSCLRLGQLDAAVPLAQAIKVQSVVAGTSNTAGIDLTINASQGTGTGAGGSIIFKVAPSGTTGTAQNALVTGLSLNSDGISFGATTIPVVTGTGTPTIAAGSTDTAGEVTSGTSATSVIITFGHAKTNAPFCTVTPQSVLLAFGYTISTTAITITQTATTGEKINYNCTQH